MAWTETINFANDTMNNRSKNAFVLAYGWSATLPNGDPNPETKSQHRTRKIKEYIKDIVKAEEERAARQALPPVITED